MMLKISVTTGNSLRKIISYSWDLFARYADVEYCFVEKGADLVLGQEGDACDIAVSKKFSRMLISGNFQHDALFADKPHIVCENGMPDVLGTAFYMVNSLQEFNSSGHDSLGRFRYENSYQSKFNCAEENLVGRYFNSLADSLAVKNVKKHQAPSRVFLSHDNDTFYGSFLQDGLYAIKKGRIDIILRLIMNEMLRKPGWFNLDRIMDIEDEQDVKSTFFWLVTKNKMNADYNIESPRIRGAIENISMRGFENGLHKSMAPSGFNDEIKRLGIPVSANRNHFLKIRLPDHYREVSESGVRLDCSLGFAESPGFRNSYGLPFSPFNIERNEVFKVVEVPLHVMDTTFYGYLHIPAAETAERVISFLEKNRFDCVLSILWHNNFFSNYKYKGFLEAYKRILSYMHESGLQSVSQKEILDRFEN